MSRVVTLLNETVVAELAALPAGIRARFSRIAALIETHGLENVHEPHVKAPRGTALGNAHHWPGWDCAGRLHHRRGKRVVVVRVFVKKTRKTPRRELELAKARAKEVI